MLQRAALEMRGWKGIPNMRLTAFNSLGLGLGALLLFSVSCRQSEGDRCQLDSDCDESIGLRCCVKPESRVQGGTCQLPENCELTEVDAGLPIDATPSEDTVMPDTSFDAGAPSDDLTADFQKADLADVDSGPADDATVDTVSPDSSVDMVTPDVSVDSVTPDISVDSVTPDANVDTVVPDSSVDTVAPDTSVDTVMPDTTVDS